MRRYTATLIAVVVALPCTAAILSWDDAYAQAVIVFDSASLVFETVLMCCICPTMERGAERAVSRHEFQSCCSEEIQDNISDFESEFQYLEIAKLWEFVFSMSSEVKPVRSRLV